ncbi:formyl transferase [Protomyces lactucae-debilis]|uniref:methionyl-tRNA formyltransferase n=1 Tax=Protomyces lactucae-debilis TaxID=2754530 RepID=A0A1Y2FC75_PROLT|nr:formyl transferase [Protomyces lactucae-debilis]ORY81528.1 formyl transferase [Protomyces lactucae-debilis]
MLKPSRLLRITTERPWSWAPFKKQREVASFPPLRVLFCGSDGFSAPSFTMLRELHLRRSDIVSSLGIMTPAPKPSGRNHKVLKPTHMALLAEKMGYKPAYAHSFVLKPEELPPGGWDLIIAVSFGHKIPASVLSLCSAGGLNVHPSLLPRHRGPAPLHHTLLQRDAETGVSVQTIHPTEFDKGDVLLRSSKIPVAHLSLQALSSSLAKTGADLLRELLIAGYPANAPTPLEPETSESYAPKITKEETRVIWSTWCTDDIALWSRVMGSLWTTMSGQVVKLGVLESVTLPVSIQAPAGTIRYVRKSVSFDETQSYTEPILAVKCCDGWVSIGKLTHAGKKERWGYEAADMDGKVFD